MLLTSSTSTHGSPRTALLAAETGFISNLQERVKRALFAQVLEQLAVPQLVDPVLAVSR